MVEKSLVVHTTGIVGLRRNRILPSLTVGEIAVDDAIGAVRLQVDLTVAQHDLTYIVGAVGGADGRDDAAAAAHGLDGNLSVSL